MAILIFSVAMWYGVIGVFDFPWVLLLPEVAFGFLLWRAANFAWPQVDAEGSARPAFSRS